jgi:copper chaperone
MQTGSVKISGNLTSQDAEKVLHALNEVWGVRKAEVNLLEKEAVFSYDEKAASKQDFEQAIMDSGFEINP